MPDTTPVPVPVEPETTVAVEPDTTPEPPAPVVPELPWWQAHRVPAGVCVLYGSGASNIHWFRNSTFHVDLAIKGRLLSVSVPGSGVRIGLPCVYVATTGPGIGVDVSATWLGPLSLDIGWFYPGRVQAGLGVTFGS